MKPKLLAGILALLTGLALAQEPPVANRCKPIDTGEPRRVLEQDQVPGVRLLEPAPVELAAGCTATEGERVRYEYEVLIDERGEVACAVLLSEVEGITPCVMKAITKSVGYSRFSEPRDAEGKPVVCYCRFFVESSLK